jgi:hypothetical protein
VAPDRIRLDLNDQEFQEALFQLPKQQQLNVLGSLRKLSQMSWDQVYGDQGFKWELIRNRIDPQGKRLYSFRIGKGFRAIALRDEEWLKILSLHPDHDSAYE